MEKNPTGPQMIPTISLFNRQRKVKFDSPELKWFLEMLASRLQVDKGFTVVLVSNRRMQELNRDFAAKDYPTDVLSFPFSDETGMDEDYLGDIVISVEKAASQAMKNLENELRILALHGLLHLLGYDHEKDSGQMKLFEDQLRAELDL